MSSNRIYEEIEPVEYVNLSTVPTKGEPILSSTSADVQVEYETIFSSTDVPVEEIEPVEYETLVVHLMYLQNVNQYSVQRMYK